MFDRDRTACYRTQVALRLLLLCPSPVSSPASVPTPAGLENWQAFVSGLRDDGGDDDDDDEDDKDQALLDQCLQLEILGPLREQAYASLSKTHAAEALLRTKPQMNCNGGEGPLPLPDNVQQQQQQPPPPPPPQQPKMPQKRGRLLQLQQLNVLEKRWKQVLDIISASPKLD